MLLSKLEELVKQLRNSEEAFSKLSRSEPRSSDSGAIIYTNKPNQSICHRSFSGADQRGDICPSKYDIYTDICSEAPNKKRAVVAVIDDLHKNEPNVNHPVIVACGINYGQQGKTDYCSEAIGLFDKTGMRPGVKHAFDVALTNKECPCDLEAKIPENKGYYLLAINLFPWITANPWGEYGFDSIDEALMVGCLGFERPFKLLETISQQLSDSDWLLFHGSRNCVAPFGMSFILQQSSRKFNVMFCRNLAYKLGKAVILCPSSGRQDLDKQNVVE